MKTLTYANIHQVLFHIFYENRTNPGQYITIRCATIQDLCEIAVRTYGMMDRMGKTPTEIQGAIMYRTEPERTLIQFVTMAMPISKATTILIEPSTQKEQTDDRGIPLPV